MSDSLKAAIDKMIGLAGEPIGKWRITYEDDLQEIVMENGWYCSGRVKRTVSMSDLQALKDKT